MRPAIGRRANPLLPLACLRGWDEVTELRASELRFSPSETAYFLNQMMVLDLSETDMAAAENRTGGAGVLFRGWPDSQTWWVTGAGIAGQPQTLEIEMSSLLRLNAGG